MRSMDEAAQFADTAARASTSPDGLIPLLEEKVLAKRVRRCVTTLARWRKQPIDPLPAILIGRSVWYDPARVNEWILRRQQQAPEARGPGRPKRA